MGGAIFVLPREKWNPPTHLLSQLGMKYKMDHAKQTQVGKPKLTTRKRNLKNTKSNLVLKNNLREQHGTTTNKFT